MTDNEKQPELAVNKDTELSIGERIQKKRREHGLSAEELVQLIAEYDFSTMNESEKGISLPTIYRYEKGEREPAAREIKLLCDALLVSPNWLLLGQEWNYTQESDSKIASAVYNLFKAVQNQGVLPNSNDSRAQTHQIKLIEIKNRHK